MARYDLQEGDGIQVESHTDLVLVMLNGRLTLPSFDVGAVNLAFHWGDTAYPVKHDGRGFFIEVDEETQPRRGRRRRGRGGPRRYGVTGHTSRGGRCPDPPWPSSPP